MQSHNHRIQAGKHNIMLNLEHIAEIFVQSGIYLIMHNQKNLKNPFLFFIVYVKGIGRLQSLTTFVSVF